MNDDMMSDKQLDKLLAAATMPRLPTGFNDRLLQTLNSGAVPERHNVVPFPTRTAIQKTSSWSGILPLVASMAAALAGGIYLGAANTVPAFNPSVGSIASTDDTGQTGFEDLVTSLQDSQS